ncbi:MAG TPA: tetratricopeptide repeat protein [Candidatus Limnocylindria bacterium]|nr:tetratricopeptide repeat protein [Candidatus Limnocylindria bacterium]
MRSSLIRKFVRPTAFHALIAALILLLSQSAAQSQDRQTTLINYSGISVEPSPQLFATMCALDAAGFAADESTLAETPSRLALRQDLLKMQGPATEAVRQFYRDHVLGDPGETLSRYVAFALLAGPPPGFRPQVKRELLPPDVLAIEGFQQILVQFYIEAQLERRWSTIEPEYTRAAARYESSLRRTVTVTNAYLREVLKPVYARTFTLYVEPLVGNHTIFRNNGDHYGIVVGAGSQIPVEEIQHAYLHFILDPLPLRHRDELKSKSALLNLAARAPRLPVQYQTDFLALTDECLIKAVELRLRHLSSAQLESALVDADESGFVLVRPLVAQLQKFEKAEPAMSYYFPDLIAGIDVAAEQKRLKKIGFAPAIPAANPKQDTAASKTQASELESWLAEGNRQIAAEDAAGAQDMFEKVLAKYPGDSRAMYGLAIASVLSGRAGRARELFEGLVSASAQPGSAELRSAGSADPSILAWSHVYLGRIDDLQGERELALAEYHAALAVKGAPEAAYVAAQRGVEQKYNPRARNDDDKGTSNANGPQ